MSSSGWSTDGKTVQMFVNGDRTAQAEVYLYGAHVTSWQDNKQQLIFLSQKAKLDGTKAIRGGIPICFPQFSDAGPLKNHGFARISVWSVSASKSSPQQQDGSSVSVTFTLSPNDVSREMWNHDFLVDYKVTLAPGVLQAEWKVHNRNSELPFSFTGALHTYFAVNDASRAGVTGLTGLTYADKVRDKKTFTESDTVVRVPGFIDRVYASAPDSMDILDGDTPYIRVEKKNMSDAVVWNPGADNARKMSDFGDDEYHNMLCVEAGTIVNPVTVNAGQEWCSTMTLSKL